MTQTSVVFVLRLLSSVNLYNKEKLAHKHTADLREKLCVSKRAPGRLSNGFGLAGGTTGGRPVVVWQKRSTEKQKHHVSSGSAGRSHCERVIKTAVRLSRVGARGRLVLLTGGYLQTALGTSRSRCNGTPLRVSVSSTGSLSTC